MLQFPPLLDGNINNSIVGLLQGLNKQYKYIANNNAWQVLSIQ